MRAADYGLRRLCSGTGHVARITKVTAFVSVRKSVLTYFRYLVQNTGGISSSINSE